MQEKCLIYIEKILKVADSFLNLVKFLLNPPILFLVDKRGCKIAHLCGLIIAFLNDVGLLTSLLYGMNANAILEDIKSINLGTVYESAVAQELHAHGCPLFYDNKKLGEVDFIIDDYTNLSVLPIEVKYRKCLYNTNQIIPWLKTKVQ